jgi:hypothetical protein
VDVDISMQDFPQSVLDKAADMSAAELVQPWRARPRATASRNLPSPAALSISAPSKGALPARETSRRLPMTAR